MVDYGKVMNNTAYVNFFNHKIVVCKILLRKFKLNKLVVEKITKYDATTTVVKKRSIFTFLDN